MPKDNVEIFWFSEQPYGHVTDADVEQYESGRLDFPNSHFDPERAHVLYNQYHEQYACADQNGFDGIMSNEHHASYWCMKPAVNIDAAVISKVTRNTKIAILGNVIAINDPIRMAEEIAMLDCISGGRIISGFVRGTAVETLQGGVAPPQNRDRFEEAHDLIIKCWTEPGPFRYEGEYYHYRKVNPWVLPMQKPHPPIWFPGFSSPESVVWAASHRHPYMNLGSLSGTHPAASATCTSTPPGRPDSSPGRNTSATCSGYSARTPTKRRRSWGANSCGRRNTATAAPASTTTRPATSPARPSASSGPCREPAGLAA